jgi:hypothetical protein
MKLHLNKMNLQTHEIMKEYYFNEKIIYIYIYSFKNVM